MSQNGYAANDRTLCTTYRIRGTTRSMVFRRGPAGELLAEVIARFHARVEDIDDGQLDDWSYAERPIRGGTALSNHASGTAGDVNALEHVLGADPRDSFTQAQIDEIHKILREAQGCVRWGGDYTGRKDGMHFEIIAGEEACQAALAAMRNTKEGFMAGLSEKEQRDLYDRIMGSLAPRWWKMVNGVAQKVPRTTAGAKRCASLDTLDGSFIMSRLGLLTERVIRAEATLAKLAGQKELTEADVRRVIEEENGDLMARWEAITERNEET